MVSQYYHEMVAMSNEFTLVVEMLIAFVVSKELSVIS
jgi:hypothetical protein